MSPTLDGICTVSQNVPSGLTVSIPALGTAPAVMGTGDKVSESVPFALRLQRRILHAVYFRIEIGSDLAQQLADTSS